MYIDVYCKCSQSDIAEKWENQRRSMRQREREQEWKRCFFSDALDG